MVALSPVCFSVEVLNRDAQIHIMLLSCCPILLVIETSVDDDANSPSVLRALEIRIFIVFREGSGFKSPIATIHLRRGD